MLTILIASDHKPFREALTRLLLAQPHFRLVAVCADTHAAINMAACEQPHVVLMDGSSDPLSAIEATKKIVAGCSTNVIALSRDIDAGFAQHMMAAGALGYLTKQSFSAEIINAVQEVAKDNVYLCNELCGETRQLAVPTPPPSTRHSTGQRIRESVINHWHGILQFTN